MAVVQAKRRENHEVVPNLPADDYLPLSPQAGISRSGPNRKERPDGSAYNPRTDSVVGGDGLTTQSAQINHRRDIQVTSPGFAKASIRRQA